jgi:hypothetical protein
MRNTSAVARVLAAVLCLSPPIVSHSALAQTLNSSSLAASLLAPPQAAKPWVYWFWINGHVSRVASRPI